jgi:DNA-binding NarL/FixJ family response regulator
VTTIHTIRVQLLHGDPLMAAGIAATLRERGNVDVLGAAAIGVGASSADVDRHSPHVIVADYEQGLAVIGLQRLLPGLREEALPKVLIVTQRDTEFEIRHALGSGVRGYLLLGCPIEEFVHAVNSLHRGMRHIDSRAAQRLAESVASEALTSREEEVLRLIVKGCINKVIANKLNIAIGTVKSHIRSIFQKLGAGSRIEVTAITKRRGLLTVDDTDFAHRGLVPQNNRPLLIPLNSRAPGGSGLGKTS